MLLKNYEKIILPSIQAPSKGRIVAKENTANTSVPFLGIETTVWPTSKLNTVAKRGFFTLIKSLAWCLPGFFAK